MVDVVTRRTVGAEVTFSITDDGFVRLLELASKTTGTVPIVHVFDNDPEYANAVVIAWCEFHGVLIVRNVPQTPQRNPWAERRIGELKRISGLDAPLAMGSLKVARTRLLDAVAVVDEHLVRPVLGNKTAREADTQPWVEYAPSQRAQLLKQVVVARDETRTRLPEKATRRQVRRAERDAALKVLEDLGLITISIGGEPRARHARRQQASSAHGSGPTVIQTTATIAPDSEL